MAPSSALGDPGRVTRRYATRRPVPLAARVVGRTKDAVVIGQAHRLPAPSVRCRPIPRRRTTRREIGRYGLGQSASIAAKPGQVGYPPGERRTEQFPPLPRPLTVQPVQTRETHGHFVVGVQADHTILWELLATAGAATGEFIGGEPRLCRSHGRSLAPGGPHPPSSVAALIYLLTATPSYVYPVAFGSPLK
jgi:hypothetical protein